ncbi:MAG: tripartite tricarboxylate transporter permease [Proteobacteria bacterium]|nr:tripartite tricarboxylate transporter permease [Pseudomonadota bacterium]
MDNLLIGLEAAFRLDRLFFMFVGTFVGLWIGMIPGLGPVMAMAILVPVTLSMDPVSGLLMLGCLHAAGTYGGSVSAIMLNVPGDAANAATTFDGYALARKGQVRVALGLSVCASFMGAIAGVMALILSARPLVEVALKFGPAEYFALAILGLTVVAAASVGSTLKALLMGCLGLGVSLVGFDPVLGFARYTFGIIYLEGKVDFVPVLIGIFAIAELMILIRRGGTIAESGRLEGSLLDGVLMVFRYPASLIRGILTGIFIGIVPGVGAVTANFVAYSVEKKAAGRPERFGEGAPEGVIGPEASNNACVSAALIPTLTLGIPGSSGAAILLVAVTLQGLRPGGILFTSSPELIYGFFVGLLVGAVMFAVLGLLLTRWFALVTVVPVPILAPVLLVVSVIGAYAYQQNPFDVATAIVFGLVGYFARLNGYPLMGLVMGLILGEMAETAFHQALQISGGSYAIFFARPLSGSILGLCIALVAWPLASAAARRFRPARG